MNTSEIICIHSVTKNECKRCRYKCEHNKERSRCRDCGGNEFCIHNKLKQQCRDCGGNAYCIHNKIKSYCRDTKRKDTKFFASVSIIILSPYLFSKSSTTFR